MTAVARLFAAFVAEYQADGEVDPRRFLNQASPAQQPELAALIDAYLVRAQRRSVDLSLSGSANTERTVDVLERALLGQAGLWPSLLPRLRAEADLKRSDLVARLAAALGVGDRKERVAGYYHQMEQGLLPSAGVSDRVLDALGQIVGQTRQALREAGQSLNASGMSQAPGDAAFARTGSGQASAPLVASEADSAEWDEVDRLFRGG